MRKVIQAAPAWYVALLVAASSLLCWNGRAAPRIADPEDLPFLLQHGKVLLIGAAALWAALHLR